MPPQGSTGMNNLIKRAPMDMPVFLTTMFYVVNHFAVAPVGFKERALMGMIFFDRKLNR